MKLSYNQATAKGCSSLEKDLVLCEKAGFDYIEIRLDMLTDYLKKHSVQELADFFSTSHLKPHAINALYLYSEFLSDEDNCQRQEELLAEFRFGCEIARAIGSHYFIIVPPLQRNVNGGPFIGRQEDSHRNCVRILKHLGQTAAADDIKLCFELVGFERSSVRTVAAADAIVRETNLANVGFVFDSYNIYLNNGLNDFSVIKEVQAEKIFAVHLMSGLDVSAAERGQDKRCFAGEGIVDVDNFLQNLKEMNYKGMVSVETFNPEYWTQEPEWVIAEAFQTLKKAMVRNHCL